MPKLIKKRVESALGKALRLHRKKLGLRQSCVAKKAGFSLPAIGALEHSRGNLATWNRVLEVLKLTLRGRNLPAASSIGCSLRILRKRRGISGRAIAEFVGVSHPTWVALEKRSQGRVSTLNAALVVLGAAPVLVEAGSQVKFYSHAAKSSAHHAWQTPKWLLKTLHEVFGTFDLDPCSPTADPRKASVRAKVYFTEADDGLSLPWTGKVFLNPPYGRELKNWIRKGRDEVRAKNAQMVCGLIPARTDTSYWAECIAREATVVFLKGRLSFDDCGQAAPFPSALIFWGGDQVAIQQLTERIPGAWNPSAPVKTEG